MIEQEQREQRKQFNPQLVQTLRFPKNLKIGIQPPVLNKIQSYCPSSTQQSSFFCGYSNGMILEYTFESLVNRQNKNNISSHQYMNPTPQYKEVYYPYQNCDVIDLEVINKELLLTCTHTEVTLLNLHKNKRICLRGHEQTPIAVSAHPISPLVVSVSNLVIQHDLRIQKPILVNYITPPVYDIKFFPDGQFYFLSGEPCRIGKDKWMRTLQNGIGSVSRNSKFILTNDMSKNIVLWDWRKSQKLRQIKGIKNQGLYQPIHFLSKQSVNSEILFFEDDGNLLHHDIIENKTTRTKLVEPQKQDNWKCQISTQTDNTKFALLYEHEKTQIRCYSLK